MVRPTMEQALTPDIKWGQLRKKNIFQIASESTMEQELQMSNDVRNCKITCSWCHFRPTTEQEHIPYAKRGQQWNKNIFQMSGEANNGTRTYSRCQVRPTMEQEHIPDVRWGQQWNKNIFYASSEVINGTRLVTYISSHYDNSQGALKSVPQHS